MSIELTPWVRCFAELCFKSSSLLRVIWRNNAIIEGYPLSFKNCILETRDLGKHWLGNGRRRPLLLRSLLPIFLALFGLGRICKLDTHERLSASRIIAAESTPRCNHLRPNSEGAKSFVVCAAERHCRFTGRRVSGGSC